MKRSHMYAFVEGYNTLPDLGVNSTARFDYFAHKNNEIAKAELKHREAAIKASKEWAAIEEGREKIKQKHALRDDKDAFILEDSANGKCYTFTPEAKEACVAELTAFNTTNKDQIDERLQVLQKFDAIMDEEMPEEELKLFHRIKKEDMPALGKKQFGIWAPLVD